MKGDLQALTGAHALLLGIVLAAPLIAPSLLPWGVEALFLFAAFQLRLADRRAGPRAGWRGWVSHIRMAPQRLAPWAAISIVALIAGPERARLSQSILVALLVGELLLYPVGASLLSRVPRKGLAGAILMLLIGCGMAETGGAPRLALVFALGMIGSVFWLRGPDGETGAMLLSLAGAATALSVALLFPAARPLAVPVGLLGTRLTLAHLSILRRRPLPWQLSGGARPLRRRPAGLP